MPRKAKPTKSEATTESAVEAARKHLLRELEQEMRADAWKVIALRNREAKKAMRANLRDFQNNAEREREMHRDEVRAMRAEYKKAATALGISEHANNQASLIVLEVERLKARCAEQERKCQDAQREAHSAKAAHGAVLNRLAAYDERGTSRDLARTVIALARHLGVDVPPSVQPLAHPMEVQLPYMSAVERAARADALLRMAREVLTVAKTTCAKAVTVEAQQPSEPRGSEAKEEATKS